MNVGVLCNKNGVHGTPIQFIDEWERCHPVVSWMDTWKECKEGRTCLSKAHEPASQTTVFPRYFRTQHDLPTSCPAPSKVTLKVGESDIFSLRHSSCVFISLKKRPVHILHNRLSLEHKGQLSSGNILHTQSFGLFIFPRKYILDVNPS